MGGILIKAIWSVVKVFFKFLGVPLLVLVSILLIFLFDFLIVKLIHFKGAKRDFLAHTNQISEPSLFEKLFILLPRQYWKNYYNRKIGSFNEHGIIIFTGKQSMGKTIAETKFLMDMQFKYPQVKVCTNYGYLKEDEVIDDWRKLVDYNNGEFGVICAIDECQNWFSSNQSKNFPPRMLATVTQNRKNRRIIIMSSHFFTNVSKPIRQHCTEVRSCRTFLKCFTVVHRKEPIMNGDGDLIKYRSLGWYSFVHSDEIYNAYDTYKVISNLSASGFKDDSWGIVQSDVSNSNKRAFKSRSISKRSATVESLTNFQIDNVMNEMGDF